jgi:phosphoribosylformylglycinamidine synthase II
MLSESQERMLLVAERGREREVFDVFHKWGLDAVEIGRVTDDGKLRVLHHGRVAAEIPAHAIAEEGPKYERPIAEPVGAGEERRSGRLFEFAAEGTDLTRNFERLLASPTIASKAWITEQYDSMVRTNTRVGPGAGDAAVLRLKETKRAIALKTDGNGRWCYLAPRLGAMHAVAEAARNVACTGARPIAATNCLNFGNPEKPEVMWEFTEAIDGITEACKALETPITGGNVSFYNETLGRPIYPTPVLGVLGLMEDAECALGSGFRNEGDEIVLLDAGTAATGPQTIDEARREISSSEYAKTIQGVVAGTPPAIDLDAEKRLIECLVKLASDKAILSAHDVSDGGIALTLAESCFGSATADGKMLSAEVDFGGGCGGDQSNARSAETPTGVPAEAALFGERGARTVVTVAAGSLARAQGIAAQYKVKIERIGYVTRGDFRIKCNGGTVIRGNVESLKRIWSELLRKTLEGE